MDTRLLCDLFYGKEVNVQATRREAWNQFAALSAFSSISHLILRWWQMLLSGLFEHLQNKQGYTKFILLINLTQLNLTMQCLVIHS